MFLSTQLVFTKSCHLNFSTSGSSSIGDGGQCGKCESSRTTSRLLQLVLLVDLLQHPGQQPSEGLKQVLFHLNFYPGGEVVNLDVHEDFAFCSSEAPRAPHAAQTSVPASEPRSQPARSAAELLALYGPGVRDSPTGS